MRVVAQNLSPELTLVEKVSFLFESALKLILFFKLSTDEFGIYFESKFHCHCFLKASFICHCGSESIVAVYSSKLSGV